MAEIPRFLVTERTPRVAPGRTAQMVAPLARISPGEFAASGQALAGVGQQIARLGVVLGQIDQRFDAAKAVVQSEEAETQLRTRGLDLGEQQLNQDFPDPVAFRDDMIAERDRLAAGLSPAAQARFLNTANDVIFRGAGELASENRQRINNRGKASFARDSERFQADMATATPLEQKALESRFREQSAAFVETGLVRPEAVEAVIVQGRTQPVFTAIQADPFAAAESILDGSLGGALLPQQKQEMLNLAQGQQRNRIAIEDRQDRIADAETEKAQLLRAGVHAEVVFNPQVTQAELYAEAADLRMDRDSEAISFSQYTQLSRVVLSRLQSLQQQRDDVQEESSRATRFQLENALLLSVSGSERGEVLRDAIDTSISGLIRPEEFNQFLGTWHSFTRADHITNQPPVREGLQLISFALAGVTSQEEMRLAFQMMTVNERARLSEALATYASEMERRRIEEGLSNARQVATEWIQRYSGQDVLGALNPIHIPPEMRRMTYADGIAHLTKLQQEGLDTGALARMLAEWQGYWSPGRRFQADTQGNTNAPRTQP